MNATDSDDIPAESPAELGECQPLQPLAGLTLLLGLLSALALVWTIFWVIPLVAVILGMFSLRLLATDPERCGRRVAILGMVLAIIFGTWAPSRYYTRQRWLGNQARVFADTWMELIKQKKFQEAHQLYGRGNQRAGEGVGLEEFYQNNRQAQTDYRMFYSVGPLEPISQASGPIEAEFESVESYEKDISVDQVALRYRVTYEERGQRREMSMRVVLRRDPDRDTGDHTWVVEGVRN